MKKVLAFTVIIGLLAFRLDALEVDNTNAEVEQTLAENEELEFNEATMADVDDDEDEDVAQNSLSLLQGEEEELQLDEEEDAQEEETASSGCKSARCWAKRCLNICSNFRPCQCYCYGIYRKTARSVFNHIKCFKKRSTGSRGKKPASSKPCTSNPCKRKQCLASCPDDSTFESRKKRRKCRGNCFIKFRANFTIHK